MLRGMRDPRTPANRRRGAFRPATDALERRELLAIDLATVDTTPYGVALVGTVGQAGGGYSVSYLGDVNGDGFDDFAVGAPTVFRQGTQVDLGLGNNSTAYIIFGSRSATAGPVDWLTLNAQQRIGQLDPFSIGQVNQTNPINGQPGFNYGGVVLTSSLNPTAFLGASVAAAGDVNGDGFQDILVGAPGSADTFGANPGTGRAYLIYGGQGLNRTLAQGNLIDVDNPPQGVSILTFTNSGVGAATFATGTAVAGVGDVLTDGFPDIAIGAPGASVGTQINAGAVYVVSGAVLRQARTAVIDLSTVGQPGAVTTAGVILAGAATGDRTGESISTAGNVDGDQTSAGQPIPDMLIGAPGAVANAGRAYLLYGAINLAAQAAPVGAVTALNLNRLGVAGTAANTVPGAIFNGAGTNDLAGFAVSTGGDFNADGFSDMLIGAPGVSGGTGQATLIYGRAGTGTPGRIAGTFTLGTLPADVGNVAFNGASGGALAGYSLSQVGRINNDQPNEIIIGSPGFNNGSGAAYLIPGNASLFGTVGLGAVESAPAFGLQMTVSGSVGGAFLGSSVSGRLTPLGQVRTLDSDLIGDVLVGASGFGLTGSFPEGGAVFGLEGAFLPLPIPPDTSIVTEIGVGSPLPPFQINAVTPAALDIYVFSNATINPPFRPATEIDPATVVVNGVAFPNAVVTTDIDRNGDGIPEAIVTITPRANLNLPNGSQTFTIEGRTLPNTPNANRRWTGSATISVVGGSNGGGGGGGPAGGPPSGFVAATVNTLQFGERFVPAPSAFDKLSYKPIPARLAIQQFLPRRGFGIRYASYYGVDVDVPRRYGLRGERGGDVGLWGAGPANYTLTRNVFTRGNIKKGQDVVFTHPVRVVPQHLQTQGFVRRPVGAQRPR